MFSEAERSELVLWQAIERGRERHPVEIRKAPPLAASDARRRMLQRPTSIRAREASQVDIGANEFETEDIEYKTEDGDQGWVPLKIVRPTRALHPGPYPVAILLHPTGANKEFMLSMMATFARRGYLTASIDCRYHGRRALQAADSRDFYEKALVRAWENGEGRPFLLDNVWDLVHLLDYLETRPDVDPKRIGMSGISLGGMHTWLCCCVDERIKVAAPMIGVQNFGWAVRNDKFHARVASIPQVFDVAAAAMHKNEVDRDVVASVWNKILPGLLDFYDAPMTIPSLAPLPLLIVNGELDDRCPVEGLESVFDRARQAYVRHDAGDAFSVRIEEGVGHAVTPDMKTAVLQWFNHHLLGHRGPEAD